MKEKREGMKWCSYHKDYHPVEEFGRNVTNRDGLHHWCRRAVSAHFAERYRKDKDFRVRKQAYSRRYYEENREKMMEAARKKRQRYKEMNTKGE